jgi:uncharacterized protein (TIGR03435 family)
MLRAQATLEFDAVSIKRNNAAPNAGGGTQSLPDGTYVGNNQPISSIIWFASPTAVREVVGLPAWAKEDRYDVIAKPPSGATPLQREQMWRRMFAQRMKLVAHLEDREIDAYALRLARPDGRLGPKLKRAAPECHTTPGGTAEPLRRLTWRNEDRGRRHDDGHPRSVARECGGAAREQPNGPTGIL